MGGHANALNARLTAAGMQEVRCTMLTWVPPCYVRYLLGRRLTPCQAATTILPAIVTDASYGNATPFANWLMMATYPDGTNPTPALLWGTDVTAPIQDRGFTEWRQACLN